jgi:hypothetical protein
MSSSGQERLREEQSRALKPRASGAVIENTYLQRRQEYIAVNRNDLEDLRVFDALESWLFAVGMFFVSGATWLGVDKYFDTGHSARVLLLCVCILSVVFGGVMCGVALVMRVKKKERIDRIFAETKPLQGT